MIAAYQRAHKSNPNAGSSMWSGYINQYNSHIHSALLSGNVEFIAHIWANPSETDVFCGFEDDMRQEPKRAVLQDDFAQSLHAARSYDSLIRLAEATGILRLENIEVPHDQRPRCPGVEEVINLLDKALGGEIEFPNPYAGEYGLATSRGVAGYRTIQALYEAWLVKTELARSDGSRVVEIGAGLGRSIFHAFRMGVADYTAVDLPFTALSQAHFLAATLGPDKIALFGEEDQHKPIKIIPPSAFFASSDRYDVAVNFDSLSEIDPSMAKLYATEITQRCKTFISVNHEFNPVRVCELFKQINEPFFQVSRHPYWMRKGYVEEIFEAPRHRYQVDIVAIRNSTSSKILAPFRRIVRALRG